MQISNLLVAAACLLTASATAVTAPTTSVSVARDGTVKVPATEAVGAVSVNQDEQEPNGNIHMDIGGWPGGSPCSAYACNYGVNKCIDKCGNGPQCKPYCECKLHSNPKSICRTQGCVKAPQGCDKYDKKRDIMDKAGIDKSDPVMELNVARPPGPFDPCFHCEMSYNSCVKKCGLGPGCPAMCKCKAIAPNPICHQCPSLQCPSLVRTVRRVAETVSDA